MLAVAGKTTVTDKLQLSNKKNIVTKKDSFKNPILNGDIFLSNQQGEFLVNLL